MSNFRLLRVLLLLLMVLGGSFLVLLGLLDGRYYQVGFGCFFVGLVGTAVTAIAADLQ